jgi:uncharacterized protein involved in cysteine biosynthesis
MLPLPCPLCGYDAAGPHCPHCGLTASDASLAAPPGGPLHGVLDGLFAVLRGLFLLATTPGVKRFLIPPLVITTGLFLGLFAWAWSAVERLIEAVRLKDVSNLHLPWGWLERAAEWVIHRGVVIWAAKASGWVLFLVLSTFIALWTFSILYEAISGPFLDEIQGRIERRWFGHDPRDDIQRPNDIPTGRRARLSAVAGAVALALVVADFLWLGGWAFWLGLFAAPLPFVAAGLYDREYGEWLWWVVRLESHTSWVSLKASALAGLLMVLFLWLKFIPVVGYFLFAGVAGFATAVSLLDIPFSRREWSVRQRLQFTLQNLLPTVAFGVVAGALFVVPVLGPLVAVPAASIGGQWLVCRLDKNRMRPRERRMARPSAAPATARSA